MAYSRIATAAALVVMWAALVNSQTPSPAACTSTTPCPLSGTYYYCSAGRELNGCRASADGPFPSFACDTQCFTGNSTGSPSPVPQPSPGTGNGTSTESPSPAPQPSPVAGNGTSTGSPSPVPQPSPGAGNGTSTESPSPAPQPSPVAGNGTSTGSPSPVPQPSPGTGNGTSTGSPSPAPQPSPPAINGTSPSPAPQPSPSADNTTVRSGNSDWQFPPEPKGCAGLDINEQDAPILIYCEKRTRPGQAQLYESKYNYMTSILQGRAQDPNDTSILYPPQPGIIVQQSVQDRGNPDYIRELQFYVNKAAYVDQLNGASGAAVQALGLNMAWFSCWWFGPADDELRAIQRSFMDGLQALGETNRSWAPLMWADDASLKSGFTINRKVDLKTPPSTPPSAISTTPLNPLTAFSNTTTTGTPLPSCTGPALPLTSQQQAAPIGLAINITTVPGGVDAHAADTNAFAEYIMESFPCVMTFVNAKDPRTSDAFTGRYFAIAYFSSLQCLDQVLLNPRSPNGKLFAQQWLSKVLAMHIRLFGTLNSTNQASIPKGLKKLNPSFAKRGHLTFHYLMTADVAKAGYMLNTVMNVNDNALTPPPEPTCSGQAVVNASQPILVYCEKRILAGELPAYHNAFDYVGSIFRGEARRPNTTGSFYPALPGITTFLSVQDAVMPDHVREIQFFSSLDSWIAYSTGVSGATITPAGLKQAWYSCAWMGLVNTQARQILQSSIDSVKDESNKSTSHIPLYWGDTLYNEHNASTSTDRGWEQPGAIKPRLDLVSGFNKNAVVDPQRPPNSPPKPPCPGPTINLTAVQQAAPLVFTINITSAKNSSAAYKTATAAMAQYMSQTFPCVQIFQSVNDPALSTDLEGKYFAVLHYSSFDCLDAALLNPTTSNGTQTVQTWFDTIQYMDISLFGVASDAEQLLIVAALRRWQPSFNSYLDRLKFNYLMKPGLSVAGYIANSQVNYNNNDPFPGWANVAP